MNLHYRVLNLKLINVRKQLRELGYVGGPEWFRLQTEATRTILEMVAVKKKLREKLN